MHKPDLPDFILNFKEIQIDSKAKKSCSRWINVFDEEFIGSKAKNLYATESLYGNWDGEVLILAQDALPASALKILIQSHLSRGEEKVLAWRHADKIPYGDSKGIKTNTAIKILKEKYLSEYRVLYGSATSHVLFDGSNSDKIIDSKKNLPSYRQSLLGYNNSILQAHLQEVLLWVIEKMPNLKAILCLGNKAWDLSLSSLNSNYACNFKILRQSSKSIEVDFLKRKIFIVPAYHPAAIVKRNVMESNWQHLKDILDNLN